MLTIDHRAGGELDGSRGILHEYETISCVHCGREIALLRVGHDLHHLANVDVLGFTPRAHSASENYVGKRTCTRCRGHLHPLSRMRSNGALCRVCAVNLELTGICPGPLDGQIEEMLGGKGLPEFPEMTAPVVEKFGPAKEAPPPL